MDDRHDHRHVERLAFVPNVCRVRLKAGAVKGPPEGGHYFMNADQMFRYLLLAGALLLLPMMLRFRLKSRTNERLDRRQEGLFILLTLRPVGLVTLGAFFVYL